MPFTATQMDLEIIILSEVSQTKTNIICYHLYVESKKSDTSELIYKTETQGLQKKEKKPMVTKGETVVGRDKLGVWDKHIHTAIYIVDNQQGLTV